MIYIAIAVFNTSKSNFIKSWWEGEESCFCLHWLQKLKTGLIGTFIFSLTGHSLIDQKWPQSRDSYFTFWICANNSKMALSTLSNLSELIWKDFVSSCQSLFILDAKLAEIPLYLNVALQAVSCLPLREFHKA